MVSLLKNQYATFHCESIRYLGSHDSRRITSLLPSKELIDEFDMLFLFKSGTKLVYYGDEIGTLSFASFDQSQRFCRFDILGMRVSIHLHLQIIMNFKNLI